MSNCLKNRYDIIIIGTGAGGGTLAYELRNSGLNILLIERGDFLPQEPENSSPEAVFAQKRYVTTEMWQDSRGRSFRPLQHYFVGGNTKVYGAALPRLRREDFEFIEHQDGVSPAWPIRYEDLEPYYARAEKVYLVHGSGGEDPTEASRSTPYPFPPLPHEPYIQTLVDQLREQGLHPFSLPVGVDLQEGGRCQYCQSCDGYPCSVLAKGDADTCCIRPALKSSNVKLMTQTYARRLLTNPTGSRVTSVEVERAGERFEIKGGIFVVACGAINSTALLLRSSNSAHPSGLANSSGLVGRYYMSHNGSGMLALNLKRLNTSVFQKTMGINDFYFQGPSWPYPMGNIQLLGKMSLEYSLPNALSFLKKGIIANRSLSVMLMSEDLPDYRNRVTLAPDGKICIHYQPNNLVAHMKLVKIARQTLRRAGYSVIFSFREWNRLIPTLHQCGTLRFGTDPRLSVLTPFCQTHDIANLYVVDASFFPSSAAINPTLTIAAQALRVAEHLMAK